MLIESTEGIGYLVGAVHKMNSARWRRSETHVVDERMVDEFLGLCESLAKKGVDAIAHPFRILSGNIGVEKLFEPMIDILKRYGIAAEINYHLNNPSVEFFSRCIEEGVRLTFGSDSHEIWELGNFVPNLGLLEHIGFDGELEDIMISPNLFG